MEQTIQLKLTDEAHTVKFGQALAHLAQKGDVFALYGTWEWAKVFLPGLYPGAYRSKGSP